MIASSKSLIGNLFKLALCLGLVSTSVSTALSEEVFSPAQSETNAKIAKYSINWHNNLADARQAAHQEHKPILWIHILGNIDGFT